MNGERVLEHWSKFQDKRIYCSLSYKVYLLFCPVEVGSSLGRGHFSRLAFGFRRFMVATVQ